jgi:hypothetical protein
MLANQVSGNSGYLNSSRTLDLDRVRIDINDSQREGIVVGFRVGDGSVTNVDDTRSNGQGGKMILLRNDNGDVCSISVTFAEARIVDTSTRWMGTD